MTNITNDLETDAYLATWAKELAASVTPTELDKLVTDYREKGRNAQSLTGSLPSGGGMRWRKFRNVKTDEGQSVVLLVAAES